MIDSLRPYKELKPSGLPWLGEIPAHWRIQSLGSLIKPRSERDRTDLPLLSVVRERGVILRKTMSREDNHNFVPDDLSNYKLAKRGDLVVNKMKAWQGSLGLAPCDGIVSPAYFVYRTWFEHAPYYQLLLRSRPYVGRFAAASDGVRVGQWDLDPQQMKRIQVPIPDGQEQKLIVRFLDWHGAQTAKLLRAKRKLLALLNEQKQAIIHRAVTRGLDPNVKLKQSGVPWLGDVPAGWSIIPLKRTASSRCDGPFGSGLKSSHYAAEGVMVVRLQNIGASEFRRTEPAFISPEHYQSLGDHSVIPGDVLVASLGDERRPCGRACVAPADLGDAMVKADCFRFRLKMDRFNPKFIAAHLSATAEASSAILSAGATRQRVNLETTARRYIAVPQLIEQTKIVEAIEAVEREYSPRFVQINAEIALLQEFRTRLIADVVTGKLDVCATAASLPEAIEPATDDEPDDGDLEEGEDAPEDEEAAA